MSAEAIARNLEGMRARVRSAARRAQRDPDAITLIGVTKTVPAEVIAMAVREGLDHIGENRVQEAVAKREAVESAPGIRPTWHLIGHLQSNKARRAVEMFSWVHSVDRLDLADRLERIASEKDINLNVLLQVDLGHEPTKHGAGEEAIEPLVEELSTRPHLTLSGLMTIPPFFDDAEEARPYFRALRELRDRLRAGGRDLPHLSMGMTGDFEVAIEEGATMIRVGRAIFGERSMG